MSGENKNRMPDNNNITSNKREPNDRPNELALYFVKTDVYMYTHFLSIWWKNVAGWSTQIKKTGNNNNGYFFNAFILHLCYSPLFFFSLLHLFCCSHRLFSIFRFAVIFCIFFSSSQNNSYYKQYFINFYPSFRYWRFNVYILCLPPSNFCSRRYEWLA